MARPRKDQAGPSAVERIRQAFWGLLEERPYQSITVKQLTQRAGVNPNTFYYHFENIDDMTVRFLEENIPTRLIDVVVEASLGGLLDLSSVENAPRIEEHYRRARMVMRSGLFGVHAASRSHVVGYWLEQIGVSAEGLSSADRARVNFIWGGITSLVASEEAETLEDYLVLLQSGIGDAVAGLIRCIGEEHGTVHSPAGA